MFNRLKQLTKTNNSCLIRECFELSALRRASQWSLHNLELCHLPQQLDVWLSKIRWNMCKFWKDVKNKNKTVKLFRFIVKSLTPSLRFDCQKKTLQNFTCYCLIPPIKLSDFTFLTVDWLLLSFDSKHWDNIFFRILDFEININVYQINM